MLQEQQHRQHLQTQEQVKQKLQNSLLNYFLFVLPINHLPPVSAKQIAEAPEIRLAPSEVDPALYAPDREITRRVYEGLTKELDLDEQAVRVLTNLSDMSGSTNPVEILSGATGRSWVGARADASSLRTSRAPCALRRGGSCARGRRYRGPGFS